MNWKYLPVLKWKRGERDALRHLRSDQWDGVVPLAEVLGDSDFNTVRDTFVSDVEIAIPKSRAIAIDTLYLSEGNPKKLEALADFCAVVRKVHPERQIIPVIHGALVEGLEVVSTKSMAQLLSFSDIIVRLRTDTIQPLQIKPLIALVKKAGFKSTSIHLLMDQFSIVGKVATDCDAMVRPYLNAAIAEKCASVTVCGGSFPVNLMGFKAGASDIARIEWEVWLKLRAVKDYGTLRYSDYAVTNPSRLAEIDPRQVNPSISIRYAGKNIWRLYKGGGFKKGKPGTLKGLCKLLILDPIYSGRTFSAGDENYDDTAKGTSDKNGIPWTWRRDATNHHIALTAGQL